MSLDEVVLSPTQQLVSRWGGYLKVVFLDAVKTPEEEKEFEVKFSRLLLILKTIEATTTVESLIRAVDKVSEKDCNYLNSKPLDKLWKTVKENKLSWTSRVKRFFTRSKDYPHFTFACGNGYNHVVKMLLNRGADIHIKDELPLRIASLNNRHKTVELLLDHGADIHVDKDLPLRGAIVSDCRLSMISLLLDRGASINSEKLTSPLYVASRNGKYELVKLLLDRGANIHANNDAALQVACYKNHLSIVKLLLDRGASVLAEDNSPLRLACMAGHLSIVELLADRGANIHDDRALRSVLRRDTLFHNLIYHFLLIRRAS
jgi:ankyrin repeat protein